MIGPVNPDNSVWDLIWTSILISFVIAGIAGVILTVYAWGQGGSIPSFFVDSGPFLLVLVTLINIGLSGLGFLEARKERRLTRKTLAEYRKDGIIETIVQTIEVLTDELRSDEAELETTKDARTTYPKLWGITMPDEELLLDISPLYPDVTDDFDEYLELRDKYKTHRDELEENVEEFIPDGLNEDQLDDLLKATGSSFESVSPNPENDSFYKRLRNESSKLAHIVMVAESPDRSKGWIDDNEEEIRDVLLELRSIEEFREDFEKLENLRMELLSKNMEIQKQNSEAKAELKERYNIREAEIRKRREAAITQAEEMRQRRISPG